MAEVEHLEGSEAVLDMGLEHNLNILTTNLNTINNTHLRHHNSNVRRCRVDRVEEIEQGMMMGLEQGSADRVQQLTLVMVVMPVSVLCVFLFLSPSEPSGAASTRGIGGTVIGLTSSTRSIHA